VERLDREQVRVGITRLHRATDDLVGPEQRPGFSTTRGQFEEARLLGPLAVGRKHLSLRQVDRLGIAIQLLVAEPDLAGIAEPGREIRAAGAIERHAPDVVPVVEQHRPAVGRPSGQAVCRPLAEVVPLGVREVRRDGAGQVHRVTRGQVPVPHLAVLPIKKVLAVRRGAVATQVPGKHGRNVTGAGVDPVEVAIARLPVGDVVRVVEADRPAAVVRDLETSQALGAQAHKALAVEVQHRQIGEVAIAIGLLLLHALDPVVLPVEDVDVGDRLVGFLRLR